jgi:hypothetical protein
MQNAKRGRGSHRGVYFCAITLLGFSLAACNGSAGSSAAASQSSSSTQNASSTASAGSGPSSGSATSSSGGSSAGNPTSVAGVTINWMPPTENTDGTALTNLAGYNIHYGTASGDLTQTLSIANPGIATYVVQNLAPGTYYFAVAAVNAAGTESPLSAEVSATVN